MEKGLQTEKESIDFNTNELIIKELKSGNKNNLDLNDNFKYDQTNEKNDFDYDFKNKSYYNDNIYTFDNNLIIPKKDICQKEENNDKEIYINYKIMEDKIIINDNMNIITIDEKKVPNFSCKNIIHLNEKNNSIDLNVSKKDNINVNKNNFSNTQNKILEIFQEKNNFDDKVMKIIEKRNIISRAKHEYVPDSIFLNLKRLKEEYFLIYDKYKNSIKCN
jgi:hypothetical protein